MSLRKLNLKDLNPSPDVSGGFAEQRSEEDQRRWEENRAQMIQAQREANARARRGED
jgi:regulator of protease activity HflC (stomatin/prohibitin superfamily)